MDQGSTTTTNTTYKQVTVDVPEERVAEFHAFFARFLAGRRGPGRRGPGGRGPEGRGPEGRGPGRHGYGRPHHGHGRRCAQRHGATPEEQVTETPAGTTEV